MDSWEVTKVLFERVHALDPENAFKITGMVLIHDNSEKEIIRLAFGPQDLLHSYIAKARAELAAKPSSSSSTVLGPLQAGGPWQMPTSGGEHTPFADGKQMRYDDGEVLYPTEYNYWSSAAGGHRQSFSLSDTEVATTGALKPCKYFLRGSCKNGSSCRFLHGLPKDDAAATKREAAVITSAKGALAERPQQFMESTIPFSPSPKGSNFLLQQMQQQSETQRLATMLLGGDNLSRFAVHSPRMDPFDFMTNAPRQIYMTFPADSTFSEENVSNYFSMYGPVQDVRIPCKQKRMFGFVTFVYPESVKIILSKGNPHFVYGARVLVKPYKEKGNVPDKIRTLQPPHQVEVPSCITPTALHDPKDPFNRWQPQIGPRMMLEDIANHKAFQRTKLEEQQRAIELQQAIEFQGRRFMGLQPLMGLQPSNCKNKVYHLGSPIGSPMYLGQTNGNVVGSGDAANLEDVTIQDNKLNRSSLAMSAPVFSAQSKIAAEGRDEEKQKENNGDGTPAVNLGEETKMESGPMTAAPIATCGFKESGVDHNLPESLLESIDSYNTGVLAQNDNIGPHHVASYLFPPTSSPKLPSCNSFQVPRFTSGDEAI